MYKHTFTQVHPYTYKYTHICTYTCMYAHTHIYIYIHISQHVDLSNINALCLGGGTRCSGRVSVPCFNVQHEFEKQYCSDNTTNRTQHHEFTGGKLSRVTQNAAELSAVFHQHGNPFESTDEDE